MEFDKILNNFRNSLSLSLSFDWKFAFPVNFAREEKKGWK